MWGIDKALRENPAYLPAIVFLAVVDLGDGNYARAAKRIEDAVAAVIAEGEVRTYDMGGSATTLEMAEAIAGKFITRSAA